MAHPVIVADECIGCGICVDACPQEVLEVNGGVVEAVNEENCIACGDCVEECPHGRHPRGRRRVTSVVDRIERGPCLYIGKGLVAYGGSIGVGLSCKAGLIFCVRRLKRAVRRRKGISGAGVRVGAGVSCQKPFENLSRSD